MRRKLICIVFLLALGQNSLICRSRSIQAADWPMWRGNAGHSASVDEDLPSALHLQWRRQFTQREPVWDDPLNRDMMPYDRIFEPVVGDGRMYLGFNDTDRIAAFDVEDGTELWSFHTDGPIRFSPVFHQGAVFVVCDDGFLYCLDAESGALDWRFQGGPSQRKVIGNRRVISSWPARGGPVVADGTVYFAAGIWPFMGVFVYALDAETGEVQWLNDDMSADYQKQPHGAPSFAGVAPQGQLAVADDLLLVPGGRTLPAALDRETGEMRFFSFGSKGEGGSFVAADEKHAFVHTRVRGTLAMDLPSGAKTDLRVNEPVIDGDQIYTTTNGEDKRVVAMDRLGKVSWEIEADGSGDLIQAGGRLYAAGADAIVAIDLPREAKNASIAWSIPVEGEVLRLLAAADRLFAVTLDGRILAFGEEPREAKTLSPEIVPLSPNEQAAEKAAALLEATDQREGYALWFGIDDPTVLEAVLQQSDLCIVAIDPDSEKVERCRHRWKQAGCYGRRIAASVGSPESYQAPPYIAHLVVLGRSMAEKITPESENLQQVYRSVRPYGGKLWIAPDSDPTAIIEQVASADLPKARSEVRRDAVVVTRAGALIGTDDWTHAYGDIANTVKSDDRRIELPLGILWFGGVSNMDILPRHGHGPSQQVVGGRIFIQGMNSLTALDVYTGRVLWKREFGDLGTFQIYYDETYANTPLSTQYNQVHIPGANTRGTNYVASEEGVYLALDHRCLLLDATSGETLREFVLPDNGRGEASEWGFIGVYRDRLLAGVGFGNYTKRMGYPFHPEGKRGVAWGPDHAGSRALLAFDRHSGEIVWRIPAELSFLHNGIVAGGGRVYLLDKLPKRVEAWNARRGRTEAGKGRILSIDAETGEILWQRDDAFGSWLSYSKKYDFLLQAGAAARDRSLDEVGQGMSVYRAETGEPVWKKPELSYVGPCILHGETIITNSTSYQENAGAFSLLDGSPRTIEDPVTGESVPWKFVRAYGCNTAVASENLLTFRSGAAGFYDLQNHGGTGNFGGFKSGCTSNLIVANGVLTAPDYTRTCTCAYQNQTSLGMVPMPENALWTYTIFGQDLVDPPEIRRIGVNFGAPGDRLSASRTLWVNYPPDDGGSPKLVIEMEGNPRWFHAHLSRMREGELPWIVSSGVEGARKIRIWFNPDADRKPGQKILPIIDSADDAEESPSGEVGLTSSDLEMTYDDGNQIIGIRYQDVPLQPSTEIERAYLQFEVDEASSEATRLEIRGQATDHAPAFDKESHNLSSREVTDGVVRWEPEPWLGDPTTGPAQQTPDLAPILREILARSDWKKGNAIAFLIRGTGKRVATSADGGRQGYPKLVIETRVDPVDAEKSDSEKATPRPGRVRLLFAEPDADVKKGERRFNVLVAGETVATDFDVIERAGGPLRTASLTLDEVPMGDSLEIELQPVTDREPILSGVEILR